MNESQETAKQAPERESVERATGSLFGGLWAPYDSKLFEDSVELFYRRLELAGFPSEWFKGKTCLDAGCGGGRNSIAMMRLGAAKVCGIDLGEKGLVDARRRSENMPNVSFEKASVLGIPYADGMFDLVWCAGVLMITADEQRALDELARVMRPGGYLYLLVYATEGIRWPLIQVLRPLAAALGQPAIEEAIARAELPPNKRRTFLDDLFCPRLDFYHWSRLERMLRQRGFADIRRWGPECRLDHEADLASYREDLIALAALFAAGADAANANSELFHATHEAVQTTIKAIRWFEAAVEKGEMTETEAMDHVIGQGHHRVIARKG